MRTWSGERLGMMVGQSGMCAAQIPSIVCIAMWSNESREQGITCLVHTRRAIDSSETPSRSRCHPVFAVDCLRNVNGQPPVSISGASQISNTGSGMLGNMTWACSFGFIQKMLSIIHRAIAEFLYHPFLLHKMYL